MMTDREILSLADNYAIMAGKGRTFSQVALLQLAREIEARAAAATAMREDPSPAAWPTGIERAAAALRALQLVMQARGIARNVGGELVPPGERVNDQNSQNESGAKP